MIWHNSTAAQTADELKSDLVSGLSETEAKNRLNAFGKNEIIYKNKVGLAKYLVSSLNNFLCIGLIVIALINLILAFTVNLHNKADDVIVILFVVVSTLLAAFFRYYSEHELENNGSKSSSVQTVIRGGKELTVDSTEIVPGDLILIKSGDYITADGRLIDSYALTCDESMVSGDMAPSEKMHDLLFEDITPLVDRHNMVYRGSFVLNGKGLVLVTETGKETVIGMRKDMKNQLESTKTPIASKLLAVKKIASVITLISAIIVFFASMIAEFSNTNVSFAVTVATNVLLAVCVYFSVGLEIIPNLILFSKACSNRRLRSKQIFFTNKTALEELKDVSVICTDKTGVITTEELEVVKVFNGFDTVELNQSEYDEKTVSLLRLSLICTNFSPDEHGERHTNKVERSIEDACIHNIGMSKIDIDGLYPKIAELPFDSDRMLMTTVTVIDGSPVSITKGAPEIIFDRCSDENLNKFRQISDCYAKEGLRVIAVALKHLDSIPANPNKEELENGLTFVGILGIEDKISEKAARVCVEAANCGIKTIMVTGDHIDTAIAVGLKAGIISDESQAISGEQLSQISDTELYEKINNYSIFARISPDDKLRIVSALKANGEKVLITGDSVNDSKALLEADFGCALGNTASELVKNSADLVIEDNHYSSIIFAIKESATVLKNTKRALSHILSVGASIIVLTIMGLIIFGFSPITAPAIIFYSVFMLTLPLYATFTNNNKEETSLFEKGVKLFDKYFLLRSFTPAIITIVLALIAYGINLSDSVMSGCGAAFTVLTFGEIAAALSLLSGNSLFSLKIFDKKLGVFVCLLTLIFFIVFVCTPIGSALSLSSFSTSGWILSIVAALLVLATSEVLKFFRKKIV